MLWFRESDSSQGTTTPAYDWCSIQVVVQRVLSVAHAPSSAACATAAARASQRPYRWATAARDTDSKTDTQHAPQQEDTACAWLVPREHGHKNRRCPRSEGCEGAQRWFLNEERCHTLQLWGQAIQAVHGMQSNACIPPMLDIPSPTDAKFGFASEVDTGVRSLPGLSHTARASANCAAAGPCSLRRLCR